MQALETDKTTKKQMNEYKKQIKELKSITDNDEYQKLLDESKYKFDLSIQKDKITLFFIGNEVYNEILEKLSAGATFYKQIHQYISTLKISTYDFAYSRQIQREDVTKNLGN